MGSRKFILALLTLVAGTLIELFCGGVSDSFLYIAGIVNGVYAVGNVGTKIVTKPKEVS
jgi:hypothetical protein